MSFNQALQKLKEQQNLSSDQMAAALDEILDQKISEDDIISFLTLLRDKGEVIDEIKGAVTSLRAKAVRIELQNPDVMDTCGTGGDQKHTFNISTAAAFIVAGAGIPVAKHGNRAVSSTSGSADVLRELGVNVEASAETVAQCIDKIGIGFLFAPHYHGTLKAVGSARKKIGTKTIFNILGPLLNPAGAKKQVIGVFDKKLLRPVAEVLRDLGSESVAVVHGDDGLDELTLTTTSQICRLQKGDIVVETFDPKSVGYDTCSEQDLVGGDAAANAKRLKLMLKGHSEAIDHCVHLNAALAIQVYGKATDFKDALLMAQQSVSSGKAFEKLEALIEMSHQA